MNEITSRIKIGVKIPFKILHMSDTHYAEANENDCARKNELAAMRHKYFLDADENLKFACEKVAETGYPLVHTGDLIDFTSHANFTKAEKFIKDTNCFFAVGNHEFSQYVGEAFEDEAYKAQSSAAVQSVVPQNISFASRVICGVNFIAADNVYYYFLPNFIESLNREAKKGLPIVLCFHTPLYEKSLYNVQMQSGNVPYIIGVPDELLNSCPKDRKLQQQTNETTWRALDYIASETNVKAVLAGHVHINHVGTLYGRIPQIITGTNTLRTVEFY